MIQCHTFNSLARLDLRDSGPYVLSQFIGGMAAPAVPVHGRHDVRLPDGQPGTPRSRARRRWRDFAAARRLHSGDRVPFRFTNWVSSLPHAGCQEFTKVDILNCMGVAMAALLRGRAVRLRRRARVSRAAAGLAIAAAVPLVGELPWERRAHAAARLPAARLGRGHFAFFPCASYLASVCHRHHRQAHRRQNASNA